MTVVEDCPVIVSCLKHVSILISNTNIRLRLACDIRTAHEISLQLRSAKQTLPGPFGIFPIKLGQSEIKKITKLVLMSMQILKKKQQKKQP